jgi:hypothetical protein
VTESFQRGRPGRGKPLTAQRELYLRLVNRDLVVPRRAVMWESTSGPADDGGGGGGCASTVANTPMDRSLLARR